MLAWLGLGQGYIRLVKLFAQPSDPTGTPTPFYNKLYTVYTHYIGDRSLDTVYSSCGQVGVQLTKHTRAC